MKEVGNASFVAETFKRWCIYFCLTFKILGSCGKELRAKKRNNILLFP